MNTYTKYFPYALISSYNFRVQKSEKNVTKAPIQKGIGEMFVCGFVCAFLNTKFLHAGYTVKAIVI